MTYISLNSIVVRIDIDDNSKTKNIVFERTTGPTEKAKQNSVTKIVGLRAKNFTITINAWGINPDILEISKLSVSYG